MPIVLSIAAFGLSLKIALLRTIGTTAGRLCFIVRICYLKDLESVCLLLLSVQVIKPLRRVT